MDSWGDAMLPHISALIIPCVTLLYTPALVQSTCPESRELHTCYSTSCANGNCTTSLQFGITGLELIASCSCWPGWSGDMCEECIVGNPVTYGVTTVMTEPSNDVTEYPHTDMNATAISNDDHHDNTTSEPPVTTAQMFDMWSWLNVSMGGVMTGITPRTLPRQLCNGILVPNIIISKCRGLSCHHGECIDVSGGVKCQCHQGWTGSHCDTCCDVTCNQGQCHVDGDTMEMYCVCNDGNYTGESNCTDRFSAHTSGAPDWLWPVVGASVGLPVVLVIILAAAAYYMWRKRFMLILRITHRLQKYDNTDKKYHVFISYKTCDEDERFVVHRLLPELEAMNLRVCVHFKDFIAGGTIQENIMKAIEDSSRSILVISPEFCAASWPKFEVQVAQEQMLKLKHKIVPIIFRDIIEARKKDNVDKLLCHILDRHTYIEWPGEENPRDLKKFWERLLLSMPKVKPLESRDGVDDKMNPRSISTTTSVDAGYDSSAESDIDHVNTIATNCLSGALDKHDHCSVEWDMLDNDPDKTVSQIDTLSDSKNILHRHDPIIVDNHSPRDSTGIIICHL